MKYLIKLRQICYIEHALDNNHKCCSVILNFSIVTTHQHIDRQKFGDLDYWIFIFESYLF
jgi:hypothetical protein